MGRAAAATSWMDLATDVTMTAQGRCRECEAMNANGREYTGTTQRKGGKKERSYSCLRFSDVPQFIRGCFRAHSRNSRCHVATVPVERRPSHAQSTHSQRTVNA